tara:strand:- start:4128 stop:4538 length:411 start_codon:yes stop_codon:yes gene_type:complete
MYDKDPEHYEYDDDEFKNYPHEYNEYGYPKQFKFDWDAWESWLLQAMEEIVQENNVWYFGGGNKDKSQINKPKSNSPLGDKYFAYLGSNNFQEPIWKNKYFVVDKIDKEYNAHIIAHAKHFLSQPQYYKSLFDIMN